MGKLFFRIESEISLLVCVAFLSFVIFQIPQEWSFFLGDYCVGEFLILVIGSVVSYYMIIKNNNKEPILPEKKVITILLLNYLALLPYLGIFPSRFSVLYLISLHLYILVKMVSLHMRTTQFTIFYSYMLFCSLLAYKVIILGPGGHEASGLGRCDYKYANIGLLFDTIILSFVGIISILCINISRYLSEKKGKETDK